MSWKRAAAAVVIACLAAMAVAAAAEAGAPLAKDLFAARKLPTRSAPRSIGFYSKGCFAGGVALPTDGPHWQVMRLSRNRRWAMPQMISLIERLSEQGARDGWNGLLVGDISQPRGGPMATGHASHQVGLDADIWAMPMPDRRLSTEARETMGARSLLKPGKEPRALDETRWTPAYAALLKDAASFPDVERIFVAPAIKKKLCDTTIGDRSWLSKIRPYWGHDEHFHVRISCPAGSPDCKAQAKPPSDDGCGKDLAWWFGQEPWRPAKGPPKPLARDVMTMASLPKACQAVLDAPAVGSAAAATMATPAAVSADTALPASAAAAPAQDIPVPTPRPEP